MQNQFVKLAYNVHWFVRAAIVKYELGTPSMHEGILERAVMYYEKLNNHLNELVENTVKYVLDTKSKKNVRETFSFRSHHERIINPSF